MLFGCVLILTLVSALKPLRGIGREKVLPAEIGI